jgi:hypothetical protein
MNLFLKALDADPACAAYRPADGAPPAPSNTQPGLSCQAYMDDLARPKANSTALIPRHSPDGACSFANSTEQPSPARLRSFPGGTEVTRQLDFAGPPPLAGAGEGCCRLAGLLARVSSAGDFRPSALPPAWRDRESVDCIRVADGAVVGWRWRERACSWAALRGRLEALRYAREHGCPD